MGERHREPRNGAKEFLQRRFFGPVPGLVNWLREPTAHAVGYVVSPSGLGALVAAMPLCGAGNSAQCHIAFPVTGMRQEFVGQTPWSARDALVPRPEQRYQHSAKREQADGGVGRSPGG